jgi:hypothetical protein
MKSRIRNLVVGLACLIAMTTSVSANASLVFEILRLDDSSAQIKATGTTTPPSFVPFSSLIIQGATSTGDGNPDFFDGTFTLGGVSPSSVDVDFGSEGFVVNFSASVPTFSNPAGIMNVTLNAETWNPVGTAGFVYDPRALELGRYSIVDNFSVPEPATLALLGLGIAGMGCQRRKRILHKTRC